MTTTSVKTRELTGAALRYAVAVAAGHEISRCDGELVYLPQGAPIRIPLFLFKPDRHWSQAGPLIERFNVLLGPEGNGWWSAECDVGNKAKHLEHFGKSLLVVICRAIAASYWGEYADIPSELARLDQCA